jgi:hypothetical protein
MTRIRGIASRLSVGWLLMVGGSSLGCYAAQTNDQTYLRTRDNWTFRRDYSRADRLFNAFDYGHAILSETLLREPEHGAVRLEGTVYRFITCDVLRSPPSVPLEERAVGPTYGALLPEAVATFKWAHMLHRQLYDIIADEQLGAEERGRRIARALRYYRSRPDLALSATPKSMDLMEGQPYSLAFRRAAPRFNRLIWSYHWLQMGLYDALLADDAPDRRRANVDATVDAFFAMLADSARGLPATMPLSAMVAPRFTELYPDAAIIFDNLHSLHDVVSDVLASPIVPAGDKRAAIAVALSRYRDATSYVTTRADWLEMSRGMGAVAMGGEAVADSVARVPRDGSSSPLAARSTICVSQSPDRPSASPRAARAGG